MRRRLTAGAVLVAAVLALSAGSSVSAAQAGSSSERDPVRVVHVEMRCHTIGDHEPIS